MTEAPSIDISLASGSEAERWDEFVAAEDSATFYHRFGWLDLIKSEFRHEVLPLMAESEGCIVGVLPMVYIRSRLFGRILCSMPFLNYAGPAASRPDVNAVLVQYAKQLAEKRSVDFLELRTDHPLSVRGFEVETHKVSMTVPLERDADEVWKRFSSKHRTNIRRAYKNGLSVEKGGSELLPEFCDVMEKSWRAAGTPIYSRSFFESVCRTLNESVQLFVCRHDGSTIAAAFNGTHRSTVEGMWAGAVPEGRKFQYSYVLYWEMIKDACERGFERYHLGRSSLNSGGESFKRKWNATSTQLYWNYHLVKSKRLPEINVDNPRYKIAIQAWRKLPLSLTRLVGPPLARNIP